MADPQFSIIIPVYNEEKRISQSIGLIFDFFKARPETTEIIFVNDGSTDLTSEILKKFHHQYTFQVIEYKINQGKGYAVRQGALSARGEWVVFFDIDLATPLEEFSQLIVNLNSKYSVLIGSRRLKQSKIEKSESKLRTFLGHCFTKISNILVPGIADFTCGFKCFSREAVKIIFSRARINRWGFDTELLYIAHLHNVPILQIPVRWHHDTQSKVNVGKAIFSSLQELLQMKSNYYKGLYK